MRPCPASTGVLLILHAPSARALTPASKCPSPALRARQAAADGVPCAAPTAANAGACTCIPADAAARSRADGVPAENCAALGGTLGGQRWQREDGACGGQANVVPGPVESGCPHACTQQGSHARERCSMLSSS